MALLLHCYTINFHLFAHSNWHQKHCDLAVILTDKESAKSGKKICATFTTL